MERSRHSALCLFTVAFLLQGNGTWQIEKNSANSLTRTQRGERVAPGFCPDGWYTHGDMCYLIVKSYKSWTEAKGECLRMKSNLVTILSQEEQEFLTLLLFKIRSQIWIGLRRSSVRNDEFEWTDSSPLGYTNWGEGEPNNHLNRENCVEMEYGGWNDLFCGENRPFICKKPKDPTLTQPGKDPTMCPGKSGWLEMSSSCYKIFHKTESFSSWSQAQSLCKSYGGNLAYVKSAPINKLLEIYAKEMKGPFWIGIKSTSKNTYTWLRKSHPLFYSNWQIDEPRDKPDEQNCVAMDTEGKWIIRDCDERHPFICEIGPEPPEAKTLEPYGVNMTCSYTSRKWQDIGGKYCYIIELQAQLKWREALCRCKEEGGSLASIHSSKEIPVLLHYIKHFNMPSQPVFIGFVRDERGSFHWSDGSAYDYANWNLGEPNGADEQCAAMFSTTGTWNDVHCHYTLGYVCSSLKVPQRENLTPKTEKSVAKLTGKETQLSAGSIVMISISCLLVMAAVIIVSLYCFGSSLKTKLMERSPYSGME